MRYPPRGPRRLARGALADNPYPADGPYASNQCDLNDDNETDVGDLLLLQQQLLSQ